MKRIALLLVIAMLAGMTSGCRFVIVENESIVVRSASAQAEGMDLFQIDDPDYSYGEEDEPFEKDIIPTVTPMGAETATPMPRVKVTPSPTPEPTPVPTAVVIGLNSRDESGESKVHDMQQRLYDLGYLTEAPDGVFGSRTLKALMRFQTDNGLEATGILDKDTRYALYPKPEVTTAPEDVMYSEGSEGSDIRVVNRKFRQYGFSTRPVTGVYDEDLAEEVMKFQQYAVNNYGTEFDDPVEAEPVELPDPATLTGGNVEAPDDADVSPESAMMMEMPVLEPEATLRPDHAVDGVISENLYDYLLSDRFPVYRQTVQFGDYGIEVERVQSRLAVLDFYYDTVTGEYGDSTATAMKGFQRRNGLQETGIADEESQSLLFSADASAAEQVEQPYYIKVSIDDQRVYVYRWLDGGYNQLIKTMICSTGYGTTTPKGVFVSPGRRDTRWHYFVEFNCWAQYAFIIKGAILFHSVIYSDNDESTLRRSTLANLGHKASHGCVRLKVEDAKWIYDNCGPGQVIEIY